MTTRIAAIAATLAMLGTGSALASPVAQTACTHAKIAGAKKCIAAGQFCSHTKRAMRDYRHHGYKCVKRKGHYRLVRR